jgi:heat shock protein HspQ
LSSIPEGDRSSRDQPYFHPLAEILESSYIAYVSEQNLLVDESGQPESHLQLGYFFFNKIANGHYTARHTQAKYLT